MSQFLVVHNNSWQTVSGLHAVSLCSLAGVEQMGFSSVQSAFQTAPAL